jgi:hypothetical protein
MKDDRNPVPRITHGLSHPVVEVALFAPLHLKVEPGVLGDYVG